ncbi:glycoside hydrolase superfamily [Desarmillaria ectypa]|nr:glycoside hydrolase superfamily [Desarmillaria ectypa]
MKCLSAFVFLAVLFSSGRAATLSSRASNTTVTSSAGTCSGHLTKFEYFGVNESGAEFGSGNIPGVLGTDYIFPAESSIDYFVGQGFNFFRLPFLLERLAPPATGITSTFNKDYLNLIKSTVEYATGKGAYIAIEPHNYLIYNGATLTSTSNFQTFWANLAKEFVHNNHVIFDIMNEPHDVDASVAFNMNQAAINGIRSTGATQLILVEGTSWTGAWTWTTSGNSNYFGKINDPAHNTAIEMHQYLDSDGSGTSATCVSSTIGAERLAAATAWLKQAGLKGFLGEIGAGSNDACMKAVFGALCSMQQSGVWIGASWWAAGPWWGTYFQSIEPTTGAAVASILPQALKPFL